MLIFYEQLSTVFLFINHEQVGLTIHVIYNVKLGLEIKGHTCCSIYIFFYIGKAFGFGNTLEICNPLIEK